MSPDPDAGRPIVRTPARRRVAPPVTPPPRRPTISFETFQRRYTDAAAIRPSPILMPIGKFRDVAISDIPDTPYLCWLVKKQIIYSPTIAAEIERVHDERCGEWHEPERDEEEGWR